MKNALALAMCAGAALTSCTFAQQMITGVPFGGEFRRDPVGFPARNAGYNGRVIVDVYDNLTNVFNNGTGGNALGANENCIDDCRFAGGPFATGTGRIITEVTYGTLVDGVATGTEQILVIFWDIDNLNYQGSTGAGSQMLAAGSVPLAVVRVNPGTGLAPGFIYQFTSGLTGLAGGGVAVPNGDTGVAVQVVWVTNGYTPTDYTNLAANGTGSTYSGCASATQRGIGFASNSLAPYNGTGATNSPGTANAATVGQTLPDYGRDISNAANCAHIGKFIGNGGVAVTAGDATAGTTEHRYVNFTVGATTVTGGQQIRLRGNVNCPLPGTITALGAIPDAGLNRTTETVAAGQTKFYSFSIASDATDATRHFFDIDTEGSTADVSIALFDANGGLAGGNNSGFDTDSSGSGTNDQLTFGVGRRQRVGDGRQYDGRDGQLPAGTYYLAVAAQGGTFGGCYTSNPPATGGGSFQLHFRTNVNGAALAPSVAPAVPNGLGLGQDFGSLNPANGDTGVGGTQTPPAYDVYWDKFTLTGAVTSTSFLDIDFARASTASADGVAYIFDSNGNEVYFSDDEGPGALPQFSIGLAGSRSYGTGGAGAVPFDGNTPPGANAGLPAGTYYMAIGLFATQDLSAISPTDGRFHVRGTSGSSLVLFCDLFTGGTTGPVCGTADFNGDGDVGTDQDIEAFFRCLAGTCCATCFPGGADFNGDGDVGTDQDIEAFFRVLAGNPC